MIKLEKITSSFKRRAAIAILALGVAAPSAYVAVELTAPAEGFSLYPYKDPSGYTTICVGHLVKKGEVVKEKYTEEECIEIFAKDWALHEKQLDRVVKVNHRSGWMKGALTDFTFNKGIGNVESSTLLKRLNEKKYDEACEQLSRWVYSKVNGVNKILPGLVIRASNQYSYCMGEIPADYKATLEQWRREG